MKTIGIIGYRGFVGSAVTEGMNHAFHIYGYDAKASQCLFYLPKRSERAEYMLTAGGERCDQSSNPIALLVANVDGPIFVCVPTPMNQDGSANTGIVESVIKVLDECAKPGMVAIIKSTVPPGTTESLNANCKNLSVCFNPEFLREATAVEDFKHQDRIIIGGPHKATKVVKTMYQKAYPEVPTTKTSSTIAEMVKYVTNCFLATKVSLANEIKQICDALSVDYDKVVEYATKDKRLGSSHWAVPGPDGHYGFGLTCFPKDLNALISRAKELSVSPTVMQAVWQKNLEVRPERDWEKMKGRAVI